MKENNTASDFSFLTSHEVAVKVLELIENRIKLSGRTAGMVSGLKDLDLLLNGFNCGELTVLAGRRSTGKTTLILAIMQTFLKERYDSDLHRFVGPGHGVGFFSPDLTANHLSLRLISFLSAVDPFKIQRGELSKNEMIVIASVSEWIASLPLWIDDSGTPTIEELCARARQMKKNHPIEVVIIDSLSLPQGKDKENETGKILKTLKALALELQIPIIALARVVPEIGNGGTESSPPLHGPFGMVERETDTLLFLTRDPGSDKVELEIVKQRNGPLGRIEMLFEGTRARFIDPPIRISS